MTYERRRWLVALILTLSSIVLSSVRTSQVRADSFDGKRVLLTATASKTPPVPTTTATKTPLPTATATKTPVPAFNCSLISLSNKRLSGNQFRIDIQSNNAFDGYITRVQL